MDPLLTERQVCELSGLSLSGFRRLRRLGRGPREIRFSERLLRFRREDVEAWLAKGNRRSGS